MIYLDHCASTPLSKAAKDSMKQFIEGQTYANAGAFHHNAGQNVKTSIEIARSNMASLLNVSSDHIIFTSGATEANNIVVTGFAQKHRGQAANIVVGATEHASVLQPAWKAAEIFGTNVITIPVDTSGVLDLDALEEALKAHQGQPTLVASMMVNNEIPVRHPIEEIGELCWQYDAALHCDAVQGIVREKIDFPDLGLSSLVFSGHKLGGPKGFGVLVINPSDKRLDVEPLLSGGKQERKMRPGTPNTMAIVSGSAAVLDFCSRQKSYLDHLNECDVAFIEVMKSRCPGFNLSVPPTPETPGIVSFWVDGIQAVEIISKLPEICMGRGAACKSGQSSSHVPAALGLSKITCEGIVRVGFGSGADIDEVLRAADRISSCAQIILEKRLGKGKRQDQKDGAFTPRPNSNSNTASTPTQNSTSISATK